MTVHSVPALVMATIAFFAGSYHLSLYLRRRVFRQDFTFALGCFAIGIYDLLCVGLYNADSPAEGVLWQRWQVVMGGVTGIAFLYFVADYTAHPSRVLCHLFAVFFTVFGIIEAIDRTSLTWLDTPDIKHVQLPFLKTEIAYMEAQAGPLSIMLCAIALLMFIYAIFMTVSLYRRGQKRRAWPLILAFSLFFAGAISDLGMMMKLYTSVYLLEYSFLGLVVVMAFTLSDELVAAAEVRRALSLSEERFRGLFENAPDAILLYDPERGYLDCNSAALELFGISTKEEFLSLHLTDLSPQDQADGVSSADRAQKGLLDTLKEGGIRLEWLYRRSDGYEFPATIHTRRMVLEGRTVIQATIHDITAQKRAENALRQSEAKFRGLIESTSDWVWELNEDGVYVYCSPQVEAILGYEPKEILGRTPFDLMHPDEAARASGVFTELGASGAPLLALENVNLHKDGHEVVLETCAVPIIDRTGKVTGYRGTDRDITERKRAEEELQREKQLSEALLNSMPGIFYLYDKELHLQQWNKNLETTTGFIAEELNQRPAMEWFSEADKERVAKAVEISFSEGENTVEASLKTKDGRFVPHLLTGVRFHWGNEDFLIGMGMDISERVQAEEELWRQKQLSDALLDSIPGIFYLFGTDERLRQWNKNHEIATGFSAEELDHRHVLEWFADADKESAAAAFRQTLSEGQTLLEAPLKMKDGRLVPYLFSGSRFRWGNEEFVMGMGLDISERVEAEKELRRQKQLSDALLVNMPGTVFVYDQEGRLRYWNRSHEIQTGYTKEELEGKSILDWFEGEDRLQVTEALKRVYAGEAVQIEVPVIMKDGTRIPCLLNGAQFQWGDDTLLMGMGLDISERVQAEEELRRQKQLSDALLDSMPGIFYVYDQKGRLQFWNKNHEVLLGYTAEELKGRFILDWVDEPYKPRITEAQEQAMKGEKVLLEAPLIHKDGRRIPYLFSGARFEWGGDSFLMGTGMDITERAQAVEALRESEARLREAQRLARFGHWCWDLRTGTVDWSPEVYELFGFSPEEFTPTIEAIRALAPWDKEQKRAATMIQRAKEDPSPSSFVQRSYRADGSIGHYASVFQGVCGEDGELVAIRGTVQDVTKMKLAEEALEKRVLALTRPLDGIQNISLSDLFNIEDLQRLQDEFADATEVASVIVDPEGRLITRPSNFCRLCSEIIRKTEKGAANCAKSDVALGRFNPSGPVIAPCMSGGLWDAGAAISIAGKHIASWMIGQVRDETQTDEKMRAYAREIGADEEEVLEAFHEVPVMSRERFEQIAQAVFTLASQLSTSAYQNVQQARFITERKEAEMELRHLRNYLANIINSMPSILIGVDADGIVTQWNNEAQRATGLIPEEAIGQPLAQAFPRLAGEVARVREAMARRQVLTTPKQAYADAGETHYESIAVFPLVANGVEGAVIRVDDVTERVRIEEMMIQTEKMMSVGGLAAGMAHEINNPLAGILQNMQVVRNRLLGRMDRNIAAAKASGTTMKTIQAYMDARKIPDMIESVLEAGGRAAKIVDNMLSFARKGGAASSSQDLAELMDQTIDMAGTDYDLKKKYDFRQIEIVREYEEDLPPVPCEAAKIQQVLLNLLRNGAEAIQDAIDQGGERAPRLAIRLARDPAGDMARIEIEDNGPGMDEETRRRVFEPFFTTKPPDRGTGLGLSVSYFIITEQHKGRMAVESTLGEGTTFIIELPLRGKPKESNDV